MNLIFPLLLAAGGYLDGEPLHQRACYQLDRDPARTTSSVRAGKAMNSVASELTAVDGSTQFDMVIDSAYNVLFFGEQVSELAVYVPAEFFTPEFMPKLRATGRYESADFKMEHLGVQTVTTLEGETFTDCDYVHIYDVNVARSHKAGKAPLQSIEMWVWVHPDVPAMGAAKLDTKVRVYGVRFRAGADYTHDSAYCMED